MTTPDGLLIHEQPGVGLVVSAAEHNHKLSEWESERAKLMAQPTFWHRGPALGGGGTAGPGCEKWPGGLWTDGDCLFIAIEVTNRNTEDTRWEFAAISISCDQHYFKVTDMTTGDGYESWEPESWAWWARIPSLPNAQGEPRPATK